MFRSLIVTSLPVPAEGSYDPLNKFKKFYPTDLYPLVNLVPSGSELLVPTSMKYGLAASAIMMKKAATRKAAAAVLAAGIIRGYGWYWMTWPPDNVAARSSESSSGLPMPSAMLMLLAVSMATLAGKRRQEDVESRTRVWALRPGPSVGYVWALVTGPGLKQKLMDSPFSKGMGKI